MDAFSYLSVLLSVILGLAIQQVLQGYRMLALNRRRVRLYWPSLAWSGIILLMVAQHWWASFSLSERGQWDFADFAAILIQTALIYMMAGLVLPISRPMSRSTSRTIISGSGCRSSVRGWRRSRGA